MVAFLEKSTGSAGFHQVIDFLNRSHICYALTKKPAVSVSFIKQFWRSAEASTDDNGEVKINATIDGHSLSITEGSLDAFYTLPFSKGAFSLNGGYSNMPQICRGTIYKQHSELPVPSLSMKVFNNMKRPTKGFSGQEVALFPTMLDVTEPSTSPSRITSSPSHSPEHSPSPTHSPSPALSPTPEHITAAPTQPSPTQPSPTHQSPGEEPHFPTPHDSPLHAVHLHGSDEGSLKLNELMNLVSKLSDLKKTKKTYSSTYTKLILRVKKLESQNKIMEKGEKARYLKTELFIQEVTPTEVIQDQEGSEKGSDEVSTAGAKERILLVRSSNSYPRRSLEELDTRRLSFAEAIRLEEQMNKEQRAQIERDEEITRQWDEEER
ncbi:hypothetical protein Tco_0546505 [Tanacetum coccineum]